MATLVSCNFYGKFRVFSSSLAYQYSSVLLDFMPLKEKIGTFLTVSFAHFTLDFADNEEAANNGDNEDKASLVKRRGSEFKTQYSKVYILIQR